MLSHLSRAFIRGLPAATHMDSVMTYVHQQGSVALSCDADGSEGPTPVALSEINAAGRNFPSLTQVRTHHHHHMVTAAAITAAIAPSSPGLL